MGAVLLMSTSSSAPSHGEPMRATHRRHSAAIYCHFPSTQYSHFFASSGYSLGKSALCSHGRRHCPATSLHEKPAEERQSCVSREPPTRCFFMGTRRQRT